MSAALVDNDVLLILEDSTVPSLLVRDAIARTVGQPCALSLVTTIETDSLETQPVWLMSLPAAAKTDVAQWQEEVIYGLTDGATRRDQPRQHEQLMSAALARGKKRPLKLSSKGVGISPPPLPCAPFT